jgi:hypothetical protein
MLVNQYVAASTFRFIIATVKFSVTTALAYYRETT